jgi:hypothetical protein
MRLVSSSDENSAASRVVRPTRVRRRVAVAVVSRSGSRAVCSRSCRTSWFGTRVNLATGQRTNFAGHFAFAPLYRFSYSPLREDNNHVLLELNTPTVAVGAPPRPGSRTPELAPSSTAMSKLLVRTGQ